MKKIHIFLIFALFFSFSFVFFNTVNVNAESNYNIRITTDAVYNPETDLKSYYFNFGYSKNNVINLVADLYNDVTPIDSSDLTFTWKDLSTNTVVNETKTFTLKKEYNEDTNKVITIGERKYRLSVNGPSISKDVDFSIDIVDDVNHEIIITEISRPLETNSSGAYVISNKSSEFTIKALLAKTKVDCTINWFLKTPNSSTFDMFVQNGDCVINPSSLVNSNNGFGIYKLYASAQSSSVLFTSKVIYFYASAGELDSDISKYKIITTIIGNSKSDLEAFTFTLNNASEDGLDFNKILWYVNNEKLGIGESFSYEPTKGEPINVKVQYQGANLILLDELDTTPRTTGTLKLILYILGTVTVLSIIFTISLKRLNKKRDVVW